MKVVIIEDDLDIIESCSLTLRIVWPELEIIEANTGRKGINAVYDYLPDVVILDLGLPDVSGFDVLKNIRLGSSVPILVLTVRNEERDVVRALELGANEYMIKPFRHMELIARIKNLLRGRSLSRLSSPVKIDKMLFDPYDNTLHKDDRRVKLTHTESKLLLLLKEHSGKVVTFIFLADVILGNNYPGAKNAIYVYICRLRKKVEEDPANPKLIRSKLGIGYYLSETT